MPQSDIIYVAETTDLASILEALRMRVMHCSRGGGFRLPNGSEVAIPIGKTVDVLEPVWVSVCLLVYGDRSDDGTYLLDRTYPTVTDREGVKAYLVDLEFSLQVIENAAVFYISDDGPTVAIDFIEQGLIASRFEECFFGIGKVARLTCVEGEIDLTLTSEPFAEQGLVLMDDDWSLDQSLVASVFSQTEKSALPGSPAAGEILARSYSDYELDKMSFEATHDAHLLPPNLLALFYLEENPNATTDDVVEHLATKHNIVMPPEKVDRLRGQLLEREPSCGCRCCPINSFWKARLPNALSKSEG